MPVGEQRIDLRTAADQLGVHYQTAYRWVRSGRLPAELVDGKYEVRTTDVTTARAARREPSPPRPPGPERLDRQAARMYDALRDGDEVGAHTIGRTLVEQGTPVTGLIQEVLVPALRRIGQAWHDGELTIWTEHRASAITERLLGELAPNPRGRRRGTALVAAVSGDTHALPTSMATVALREDQWHVHHLGADMPPEELERFCRSHPVDLTVLTVTNPDRADVATRTADELRAHGIPVIVGSPGRSLHELVDLARATCRPTAG